MADRVGPGAESHGSSRWIRLALVITVAVVSYAGVVPSRFVFDDQIAIVDNPVVRGTVPLHEVIERDWWGHRQALSAGLYRPLAVTWLRAEWVLGNGGPWLFHALSVFLHAGVMALLFMVLCELTTGPVALAATLFCAVFAASSEAVETAVGQADLLSAGAILLGLAAHRRAGLTAAVTAAIALVVAVGTKETGLLAVVAWGLLDWLLPPATTWRERLGRYAGFAGVIGAYLVLRYRAIGTLRTPVYLDALANPLTMNGPVERVLGAGRVFVTRYLAGLIDPTRRLFQCSYRACVPSPPSDVVAWIGLALAGGLVALFFLLRRRAAIAAAGLGWFLLFFLPVSNLIVPATTSYGERLLYLPDIGLGLALAYAAAQVASRIPRPALVWGLFGTILFANAVAVQFRHADWRSGESLARSGLAWAPDSAPILSMYAVELGLRGDNAGAESYARQAVALWDTYGYAHKALAISLDSLGRTDEAEQEFRRAVEVLDQSDLHADYAVFLARHGRFDEAMKVVERRRTADPDSARLVELEALLRAALAKRPK
jgi:hypothetical protein